MALEEHYEDYKNLSKQITESEKVFFVNDPYSIPIIHSAAQEASNETKRLFGINGHNDLSDARSGIVISLLCFHETWAIMTL
ncbi:hypothetical protein KKJ01_00515 [Xenorhabdus bovienii]|uniref:Uncharacterized protein n=1 Tax=Xenorhabdus bovienii TaxID=40576 RepID=A0AAJ1MWY1_XENBV|nr:hypothetical protein [Xenorhabdus bovienii]MDE1476769.1 hypothetical protein [Xenorhabdus bovienii]MDE1490656.1 hypothetical protein [Xenorhabdus bovienii]MDE9508521.1 hypothetical protein [Xenorhabdus bovienii]MDE9520156.1 hypothetical protein [Xenorhabdus bovienii]